MKMKNYFGLAERGLRVRNFAKIILLSTGLLFFASACITLGKDFPVAYVPAIKIGRQAKVRFAKCSDHRGFRGIRMENSPGHTVITIILFLENVRQKIW